KWFAYWVAERLRWWTDAVGVASDRLRLRPHDAGELSHYSKQTTDIEYAFPMGWSELEGVADRTDYDLTAHSRGSGKSLTYFDEAAGDDELPYLIEPAMGEGRRGLRRLRRSYDGLERERKSGVYVQL